MAHKVQKDATIL